MFEIRKAKNIYNKDKKNCYNETQFFSSFLTFEIIKSSYIFCKGKSIFYKFETTVILFFLLMLLLREHLGEKEFKKIILTFRVKFVTSMKKIFPIKYRKSILSAINNRYFFYLSLYESKNVSYSEIIEIIISEFSNIILTDELKKSFSIYADDSPLVVTSFSETLKNDMFIRDFFKKCFPPLMIYCDEYLEAYTAEQSKR